jgi:hypothetical protein
VLAGLLALLSVIAIWTRNQVLNTDRYVATVAPLATEPAIQDLIVDRLTATLADPDRTAEFASGLLPRGPSRSRPRSHRRSRASCAPGSATSCARRASPTCGTG